MRAPSRADKTVGISRTIIALILGLLIYLITKSIRK